MRRRHAFTIIEMLVSVALIMFIMVILTEAFSSGMETFRHLKAIGDMQERLRSTTSLLRRDLSADHFEGHRRLGDPTFWQDGNPVLGFFRFQATPNNQGNYSLWEGRDPDITLGGVYNQMTPAPFRSPIPLAALVPDYQLSFSVKLRGNGRENFFSANVPQNSPLLPVALSGSPNPVDTTFYNYSQTGSDSQFQDTLGTYNSQWAEVTYFLWPNGTNAGTNMPLFTLWRSQLVVVPDNRAAPQTFPSGAGGVNAFIPSSVFLVYPPPYSDMSCYPVGNTAFFPSPNDLIQPNLRAFAKRFGLARMDPNFPVDGPTDFAAPLLSDVLSFDVRALYMTPTAPPPLNQALPLLPTFRDLVLTPQNGTWSFDTADPVYTGNISLNNNTQVIKALQISIRVWDLKTQQARQVTIIQDM